MEKVFRMVGGEDEASYAKNSSVQRLVLGKVKPILEKSIEELLHDMDDLPSCIKVADLGCSSGPNTFLTLQHIIESIDKAFSSQIGKHDQEPPEPEIQYFLNDLVSNDFNLVFKGLPEFYEKLEKQNGSRRPCLVAATPGTFYGKLFPDRSMHILHSSYSIHWLSQVPRELVTKSVITKNEGNIFCGKTSPPIVRQLYSEQFGKDLSMFLRIRSQEMVQYGHLLLTLVCENFEEEDDGSKPNYLDAIGMTLTDLVKEGCIEEEELDTFYIPLYKASADEIKQVIENEESFKILKFHTFTVPSDDIFATERCDLRRPDDDDPLYKARQAATHFRAIFEPILANHFGETIMDDFFRRYTHKLVNIVEMRQGSSVSSVNNVVISLGKK